MRNATISALLLVGVTIASFSGIAIACTQPVAVERGKGEQQSATQATNVGAYEWSDSQQAYVLSNAWYDASLLYLPLQPHEIDVTDDMSNQPLASGTKEDRQSGGPNGLCIETELPVVTVVAVPPSPGRRMTGFTMRRYVVAQTGGGLPRMAIAPQWSPAETRIDNRVCNEQDDNAELEACAAIVTALGGVTPAANQIWIITYGDGRRHDWRTNGQRSLCVAVEGNRGCY